LRTDGFFIRAQSTIRADGIRPRNNTALEQGEARVMCPTNLRASPANRVFRTDKKHPYGKRGFD